MDKKIEQIYTDEEKTVVLEGPDVLYNPENRSWDPELKASLDPASYDFPEDEEKSTISSFTLHEYENVGMGLQEVNTVHITLENGALKISGRQFAGGVWEHVSVSCQPSETRHYLRQLSVFYLDAMQELDNASNS